MSYTRQFDGYSIALLDEMATICEWLRANDVPVDDVPLDARVTLDRRNMTIDVYLRRDGHVYLSGDGPARGTITVPIHRRPPVLASLGPARCKRGG